MIQLLRIYRTSKFKETESRIVFVRAGVEEADKRRREEEREYGSRR